MHWRRTKVETTGATQDYETLISRLFETFLYFETKKQVVPWHQWHHLVRRHWIYFSIVFTKCFFLFKFSDQQQPKVVMRRSKSGGQQNEDRKKNRNSKLLRGLGSMFKIGSNSIERTKDTKVMTRKSMPSPETLTNSGNKLISRNFSDCDVLTF